MCGVRRGRGKKDHRGGRVGVLVTPEPGSGGIR